MQEIWRKVKGYESYYEISNKGNVKSLIGWDGKKYIEREKILKQTFTSTGYKKVELYMLKKRKSKKVHRLVAIAFIDNPNNKPYINHIDGNPLNNNVSNLEWCTQQENVIHAIRIGLKKVLYIPEEELIEKYKHMSAKQIAKDYSVSICTIIRFLNKYNISKVPTSQRNDIYKINMEELLIDFRLGRKNKELVKKYNCSRDIIATRKYQFKKRGLI